MTVSRILVFIILLSWMFSSCESEPSPSPETVVMEDGNMVLVGHEGNFKWGNAGLGLINLNKGQSDMDIYKTLNKKSLGDVFQSATWWNQHWWVVVNNSGKIEVLDKELKMVKTVTGFTSPRYLLPVSDSKAYVTDLYGKEIRVVSPGQTTAGSRIAMPGWTEEMALVDGRVYVVCKTNAKLIRIDPVLDEVVDSILLPGNARSVAWAGSKKVWIGFEAGNGTKPGVCLYDADSARIVKTWFSTSDEKIPDRFQSSATGDSLFFLCGVPCFLQGRESDFVRLPLGSGNWYGLGYDARRQQLFASDAKDYLQNSRIVQMDLSGKIVKEWKGGIISSRFYFW
jgi:hypothetical protein